MVKKCLSRMSGKLSRTVLRRGKGSNLFFLVDYTSYNYHKFLDKNKMIPSMSRLGTPIDNAPMESFFSTIKVEWLPDTSKMTTSHVINEIKDYMQFYNTIRIKSDSGMTPFEKRKMVA